MTDRPDFPEATPRGHGTGPAARALGGAHFPGRLGAVADWLVRRRGYRSWFYCHTLEPREAGRRRSGRGWRSRSSGWAASLRESAVTWSRALERSLCYAYGCWEVLEQKRPRPIDLDRRPVGRAGLGPVRAGVLPGRAGRPVPGLLLSRPRHDLADEAGPDTPPAYFHWRRSMAAIELLDLEQAALGLDAHRAGSAGSSRGVPRRLLVLHDGVDTRRFARSAWHADRRRGAVDRRPVDPGSTRVVTFVARSLDRLRGFDRFLAVADAVLRARPDVLCVVVGEPIVRRGLDVAFHNKDYPAHLMAQRPPVDPDRLWFLGTSDARGRWPRSWPPATCISRRAGRIRWRGRRSRPWPPAASCWPPTPSRTGKSSRRARPGS